MKKLCNFLIILLVTLLISHQALASLIGVDVSLTGVPSSINTLIHQVHQMSIAIDNSSSSMMRLGDMLICYSHYSESAQVKFSIVKIPIEFQFIVFKTFISGCLLYIIGFFITMIAAFYMFDIAFNLSLTLLLLPLALALWPFKWTKSYLKKVIENILYYVGIFIFLPLGISLAQLLVIHVIQEACGPDVDFVQAFDTDSSDIIEEIFGLASFSFWKILIAYIVAIRILPLLADDFCKHFFGTALLGSPMSQRLTQAISVMKKNSIDKLGRYAKDVTKHSAGTALSNSTRNSTSFMGKTLNGYGKRMAKTR